jgi:glyoxylase-like metal-dependent hydrolase (beta-lactamase superfamily II)
MNHLDHDSLQVSMSRRRLIGGASAVAAGLAAGVAPLPVMAKAPLANTQAPSFYRFKIGSIEATVVSDGPLPIGPPKNAFKGVPEAELAKMMTDNFLPTDEVVLDQNNLVINTGDKLVLFDTGMTSVKRPGTNMGRLLISLRQAGIDPKDIDAIVLTHPHIDHSGGIMSEDGATRNFPNAQIYTTQLDFDFWTDEARMGTPAEGSARTARKNLLPNRDRIIYYKDGQEVIPGVVAMHTPGHTVGHSVFMITSGNQTLCNLGDIAHHVALFDKPRMEVNFDTDSKQGVDTRLKVFDMLTAQRVHTLVYHLPWPGLGHIAKSADGYRFIASPMQLI